MNYIYLSIQAFTSLAFIIWSINYYIKNRTNIQYDIVLLKAKNCISIFWLSSMILYSYKDLIIFSIIEILIFIIYFMYLYYHRFDFKISVKNNLDIIEIIDEVLSKNQVEFETFYYDKIDETDFQFKNSKGLIEVKSGIEINFKSRKYINKEIINEIYKKTISRIPEEVVKEANRRGTFYLKLELLFCFAVIVISTIINYIHAPK